MEKNMVDNGETWWKNAYQLTIFYDIYGHMCLKLGEICSHSG
jgi:hypothetical protein